MEGEQQDQNQPEPVTTPEYWNKEFAAAKKWFQKYHALARKVEKSFLLDSESDDASTDADVDNLAKYNLFWSNVQTLLAAFYGRMPKVEVDRSNMDPNDDVARVAGIILERIFNIEYTNLDDSPYYVYQEAIQDRLVAGMGIGWARYSFTESTETIDVPPIAGQPPAEPVVIPIITDELAPLDYVNWEDFLYSPCKRWQDKRWVARRVPMAKPEVTKKWGSIKAEKIPYNLKGGRSTDDPVKASVENQADIWEIWNLETRWAYWYVPGAEELLDAKEDPLKLRDFWPLKRPLFATMLSKKCLPRPDFKYAQGQYGELNLVVQRCRLLTDALKVVGVYDKTSEGLQRLLNQANMNQMIPVDNWALFAEKGGIKGVVDWFPLEMVINTLEKLTMRKAALVQEIYEVLGISDIQRGMATTKETATTQKLKAHYGSARSDKTQNEIARFITDHTRLRAEIICKHWSPETIVARSQIDKTQEDQGLVMAAVEALKADPNLLISRLTVAADTIAAPDWEMEKQQRIDFLQAISQFIGMAMPMIQVEPGIGPFMIQIIQWASTGFKGAKQIEGVLDQAYQRMAAVAKAAEGKPKEPTAEEKLKLAQTEKAEAEARFKNLETVLAAAGLDVAQLLALAVVPPAETGVPQVPPGTTLPGTPPAAPAPDGTTPGAPPAKPTPSTPRPQPTSMKP